MTDSNPPPEPSKFAMVFNDLLLDLVIFYVWVKAVFRVLTEDFEPIFILASVSLLLMVLALFQGGPI